MDTITVTLRRSLIGATERQRATVAGLGLRHINQTRTLENTPAVRGMIKRVIHLVEVAELASSDQG
jgi:large subunit ribosomal protein L30